MARYVTEREFTKQVRVCLDENMSSEALSALKDVDTLSLDAIISSKAEDAALSVLRAAPIDKLGDIAQSLEATPVISVTSPHKGIVSLPLDFERIVRFKMSSWKHPLFEAKPPFTPLYEQANSGFNVYGTKDRPVVFLVPSTSNASDLALEVFCAGKAEDTLDGCLYAATPKKEGIATDDDNSGDSGSTGDNTGDHTGDNTGDNTGDDNTGGDDTGGDDTGGDDTPVVTNPDYVDLGLPSGTLWATKNIGAETPHECGDFFAWGEVEPKSNDQYTWDGYELNEGDTTNVSPSKYNSIDYLDELEPVDDAATHSLGLDWEMPSKEQINELLDSNYTEASWALQNDVNGLMVKSKANENNRIFIPAGGFYNWDGVNTFETSSVKQVGHVCSLWSKSCKRPDTKLDAECLLFGDTQEYAQYKSVTAQRCLGKNVRPVLKSRGRKNVRITDSTSTSNATSWRMLLGERMLRPTIYYAAYLTALAVKDESAAEKLLLIAKSLIEN